jgi:CBS domain containing-hemolysin-like protein
MTEALLLLVALGLVAACGGFVAAEFAFVTVDRASVERATEGGDRAAGGVLAALRTLSTQLSGAQVGITVTNLAIGFLAEPAIARLVDGPLVAAGVPESAVRGVALGLGLGVGTFLTMVFGELVPKNLAIAQPFATARRVHAYQRGFTAAMAFPIRGLNGAANGILRVLGVEPQEELRSARSPQELASLVQRSAQQGVLDRPTATLLTRSLAFGRRTAADVMTPRVRMTTVDDTAPVSEIVALARRTGHSRFPVVRGEADEVVGAVHVKHALAVALTDRDRVRVGEVAVASSSVPETLELDPLLVLLRGEGMQLAVVVDEYGGTAGVVTLEDVVEEIVGDIADEHDRAGTHARRRRDGSWSLSGLLRPDEVAEATGVALPEGAHYETLAGLVLDKLGHVPAVGESATVPLVPPGDVEVGPALPAEGGVRAAVLTVKRLDGLRIDRVALEVLSEQPEAGGEP